MIPDLNAREVRLAVKEILLESCEHCDIKLREIKFKNNMLYLKGKSFFRYDHHLHYTNKNLHPYAVFKFLKSLENVMRLMKFKKVMDHGIMI